MLINKPSDIFNPISITALTSEDGQNFTEVAKVEYPVELQSDPEGIKDYTLTFPETSAKYLKVVAVPVQSKPEWHARKGRKGFIFIDEIIVK